MSRTAQLKSTAAVLEPRTLNEALEMRARAPDAMPLAGGTDVMVSLEAGVIDPPRFLNLWRLDALRKIEDTPAGGVRIGALCTYTSLGRSDLVLRHASVLIEAARTVGATQIQNRGTLGGNIVNASPAGDTLPVLLALDAVFELSSAERGARLVAAADFFLGYRQTALLPDELLIAIHLPARNADDHTHYRKVGTRLAQAISKVVLGARLRVVDGQVVEARIAWGSVGPVPMRSPSVEAALLGVPIDVDAEAKVAQDIRPIDDIRSTADYRQRVAENVLRSFLRSVVQTRS